MWVQSGTKTVGTAQRTIDEVYVKVHAFELLGGLKSEEPAQEAAPAWRRKWRMPRKSGEVFDEGADGDRVDRASISPGCRVTRLECCI